jgi:hypothetical protein
LVIITIFLYTDYIITAGAVLCAGYVIAAVKRFADTCYKSEKNITKDIICYKDREGEQRRKELVISLIKIKLRRF